MTAGRGIAHSDPHRSIEPCFDHYDDLPVFEWKEIGIRLFVGEFLGHVSPAKIFSQMIGAEIDIPPESTAELPADSSFEYGVLAVSGQAKVNGNLVSLGQLHYVPAGMQGLAEPEPAISCIPRSHRRAYSSTALAKSKT